MALLEHWFGQPPVIYTDAQTHTDSVSVYCAKLPAREAELRTWLRAGLNRIQNCGLDIGASGVSIRRVRHEDWAESWKRHFQPLEIGGTLLVAPSWSRRRPRAGQAVVVLDPGLSFGTGQHPTTAFCLQRLLACRKIGQSQSFLDIGAGSGILAIAAARLGYCPVRAFDSDRVAVRSASINALRNGVQNQVRISRQDLTCLPIRSSAKFSVVCANLTCDLLIEQAKRVLNRLEPCGRLILAGILETEFSSVKRHYAAAGLKLIATQAEKGWQSGVFAFK